MKTKYSMVPLINASFFPENVEEELENQGTGTHCNTEIIWAYRDSTPLLYQWLLDIGLQPKPRKKYIRFVMSGT